MVKFFLIFRGFFFKNSAKKKLQFFFNFPRIFFQKSREKKSREKNTPQKKIQQQQQLQFYFLNKIEKFPKNSQFWRRFNFGKNQICQNKLCQKILRNF